MKIETNINTEALDLEQALQNGTASLPAPGPSIEDHLVRLRKAMQNQEEQNIPMVMADPCEDVAEVEVID